jgi:hypothetical protein
MFSGRLQPAQAGKAEFAGVGGDWDPVRALVTRMTDETRRVLSGRVFMNCSRERREQ